METPRIVIGTKSERTAHVVRILFYAFTLILMLVSALYVVEAFGWLWGVAIAAVPFAIMMLAFLAVRNLPDTMLEMDSERIYVMNIFEVSLKNIIPHTVKTRKWFFSSVIFQMAGAGAFRCSYLKDCDLVAEIIRKELVRVHYCPWNEFVNWATDGDINDLTDDYEKAAKYLFWVQAEVNNGGYQQFFTNWEGWKHEELNKIIKNHLPKGHYDNHIKAYQDFKKDEFASAQYLNLGKALEADDDVILYAPDNYFYNNEESFMDALQKMAEKIKPNPYV